MKDNSELAFPDKIKFYVVLVIAVFSLAVITKASYLNSFLEIDKGNNIILGWVLVGIFIVLAVYSLKKRQVVMTLGRLKLWYSSHFYLGTISIIILMIHSGLALGFGLSKIIIFLTIFTLLNGIYGIVMHFFIPQILVNQNAEFTHITEIDDKKLEFREKLDQLLKDKSEHLINLYKVFIEKSIQKNTGYIVFFKLNYCKKHKLSNHLKSLAEKETEVPENERPAYREILEYYGKILELSRQMFFIRLMNNWLNYHISASALLFLLVALHIFSFYYY